jgi:transcriptional regulator GlxA family with amidase domain
VKTIGIAIFPGVQSLDVAGPLDVFAEANSFVGRTDGYAITLVGTDRAPFRASNGMQLVADVAFDEAGGGYDLLLVAGGPALPTAGCDPRLVAWLAATAPGCAEYGSICTGAFALGHAGLIDDMRVTTHWSDARMLAEQFPRARVEHDRIFMRDERLVTSAGVTAGIDLGLAIVHEDHGPEVALAVAKRLVVVAQRQGGQSQFSPLLIPPPKPRSPIISVHEHVMSDLRAKHSVEALAAVAGMSARSFARIFKQETKLTPAEFVEGARIDAARNRLEAGDQALKVVAYDCGFHNAEHMRLAFVRRLGLTPSDYRLRFRAKR